MKTLKLFNAVIAKDTKENPFISDDGFIIEPNAIWAKDKIVNYYKNEMLGGNALNKTFHKSWSVIKNSSRAELLIEQIKHYISTYGSKFTTEAYIPNEVLDIPDLKVTYKVIKAYTIEEMTEKCLSLLRSGIALTEETIDDVLEILGYDLKYKFTGKEGIKNKEAIVKIAELFDVYPDNTVEFFRYIIFRTTNTTLLIKNNELIDLIKNSLFNPSMLFNKHGLERMAEIFNRFKPLFLAYKNKCPMVINKLSKLSKKYHKPLVSNALNEITFRRLTDADKHWLDNATIYSLFKALSATYNRMNEQDAFVYRVRNGKSWIKEGKANVNLNKDNYKFILNFLKDKYSLKDKTVFIPKDVKYALPTSEKMYVGNIPTGTKFIGKKLAVGVYWENSWGARDLDISGINVGGKIGWNSDYKQGGSLYFSGDMTDAPEGAVEYLYANKGLNEPTLVENNVYEGDSNCDYKIIIGKGDKVSKDYMMNPNKLFAEVKCKSVQKQTILGIFIPEKDKEKQSFVVLNFGAGQARVSGHSPVTNTATKALYQQWANPLNVKDIIKELGGKVTKDSEDEVDFNLSLDKLEKDTFIKLFDK